MEFGDCPYCSEPVINYVPDEVRLPVLEKVECGSCHKEYFIKHSRILPEAYTVEEAQKQFPDMKPAKSSP